MDISANVPRYPGLGELVEGTRLGFFIGGKGANQAIASAKAGVKTRLHSMVGVDSFGEQLKTQIKDYGVDVSNVKTTKTTHTGTTLIFVTDQGINTMIATFAANNYFSPNDLASLKCDKRDVCVSMLEIPTETIQAFFEKAKANGCTTILTATCRPCPKQLLDLYDILIMNEKEFDFHSQIPNASKKQF